MVPRKKVRITNPKTGKSVIATKVAEGKSKQPPPTRAVDIAADFKKLTAPNGDNHE